MASQRHVMASRYGVIVTSRRHGVTSRRHITASQDNRQDNSRDNPKYHTTSDQILKSKCLISLCSDFMVRDFTV